MTVVAVLVVASGGLVAGATWGLFGPLSDRGEGALVALAGGALVYSTATELIAPAAESAPVGWVGASVLAGAGAFCVADYVVDVRWDAPRGAGLLVAIVMDGVPENLALGVSLIGSRPVQVAALTGSILLSNLPEAAGGARQMQMDGHPRGHVLRLWTATAVILVGAGLAGNLVLADASQGAIGAAEAFAGGAVAASLATEVFPEAFDEGSYAAGIAAAAGLVVALLLSRLGR